MVDLVTFPWGALATLISGSLAVAGAYRIAQKQTKIQESQVKLSEANVRITIFDKRRECVSRMREIHSLWWQNARLTDEEWREFREFFLNQSSCFLSN